MWQFAPSLDATRHAGVMFPAVVAAWPRRWYACQSEARGPPDNHATDTWTGAAGMANMPQIPDVARVTLIDHQLDRRRPPGHHSFMSASGAAPLPRLGEVFFDVRGDSRSMRLSWYADTGVAVFSIWQGGVCTGTFRLPMDDLDRMIEILRRGPQDKHGRRHDPRDRRTDGRGSAGHGQPDADATQFSFEAVPDGTTYAAPVGGRGQSRRPAESAAAGYEPPAHEADGYQTGGYEPGRPDVGGHRSGGYESGGQQSYESGGQQSYESGGQQSGRYEPAG